jgi:ATP-binding cassette subfamily B protein
VARDDFARARRFLHYRRWAAWTAVASSFCLAFFYILLLALFGFVVALVVERGQLRDLNGDSVRTLSAADERWLAELVDDADERGELKERIAKGEGVGLVALAYRARLADRPWQDLVAFPVAWFDWTRSNWTMMVGLLILAFGVGTIRYLLHLLMQATAATAVVEATTRFRRAVYHQTYRLGALVFKAEGANEAIGVFTRSVEAVQEGLYTWLTVTFREPTKVLLLLAFAPTVEWLASEGFPWLTVAFILSAILIYVVGGQLAALFRRRSRVNARRGAETLALLQESLHMMRLAKCYQMELFNQTRVERQLAAYSRSIFRRYRGEALYKQTLVYLGMLAGAVLLFVAGWNILEGELSVASILTLSLALLSLLAPTRRLLEQRRVFRQARESARELFAFLDRKGDVSQEVNARFLKPLHRTLEFDEVTLREPGTGRMLLDRVTFTVTAGQRIALVGQDDSAKYALFYLIPRFLDPDDGQIRIDGHRIHKATLESLRLQVAVVLQQHLVFTDSVFNNISGGDSAYSMPQVIEAAKIAHAHQSILQLPGGYNTIIGDLGHPLSPLEKFRIGMARAILRDPAIMLIEEPTAALDDDDRALLDDTYTRFLPGRTAIFLPHRLTTIKTCDRVLLLHQGRVEAEGRHRDLLTASERYRHLQYLEFNVFAEESQEAAG